MAPQSHYFHTDLHTVLNFVSNGESCDGPVKTVRPRSTRNNKHQSQLELPK